MKATHLLATVLLGLSAHAQPFSIASLQGNGVLSWNGDATNFGAYSVEWAPTVTGPWSSSWTGLTNIAPSNGTMAVSVPMFYRVVGRPVARAGDACDTAEAVLPGVLIQASTAGYANDYDGSSFGVPTPGRDRVYRISVPAGIRLKATVTPTGQQDFALLFLPTPCSQASLGTLTAVNDGGQGAPETASWLNLTAAASEVLVVVDSPTAGDAGGDYQLGVVLEAPPAGDTCANATALMVPTVLTGQTTIGFANDHTSGTGCVAAAGPDSYYSLIIPAGYTLSATVTPTSSWNPSVSIINTGGCSSSGTCLASSDTAGTGAAESVQYPNSGPTAVSLYIVVDSASTSEAGTFTLAATLTFP